MSAAFGGVGKGQSSGNGCSFAEPFTMSEPQVFRDQSGRMLGYKALRRAVHSQPGRLYIETGLCWAPSSLCGHGVLGDRAGIASLVALSVQGLFVIILMSLTSHPNLRGDDTGGLPPNTPGLMGKGTDPS